MGSPVILLTTCPLTVCDVDALCGPALTWLVQIVAAVTSTTDGSCRIIRLRVVMRASLIR
jgi:hypothetical protein